jgi:hypothetical protein
MWYQGLRQRESLIGCALAPNCSVDLDCWVRSDSVIKAGGGREVAVSADEHASTSVGTEARCD